MGERIYHLGPVGAGAMAKLINNMLGAINVLGVYEGLVLGAKAGLDPRLLAEVVSNGSGASRQFNAGVPNVLRRDFEPGFTLDADAQGRGAGPGDWARSLGVRLEAGALAVQTLEETRQAGLGDRIYAGIKFLERMAGVEVKGSRPPTPSAPPDCGPGSPGRWPPR